MWKCEAYFPKLPGYYSLIRSKPRVKRIKRETVLIVNLPIAELDYNKKTPHLSMSTVQRPNYAKIPLEKRQSLVQMVFQEQMSIAEAGRILQLKPSTAKLIVRKYRQTGSFFIKQSQKTDPQEVMIPNEILLANSMNFGNRAQYANNQMAPLNQFNVACQGSYALDPLQMVFYYVFPLENTGLVVYY